MNNRPLAMGGGAVFLTNSPFATPLLFVKSPIVTALISQRSGDTYFLQIINSIAVRCLHLLDEEASIQQGIYDLLPLSKHLSLRQYVLPRPPSLSLVTSIQEESIIHQPIPPIINQASIQEDMASKRLRLDPVVSVQSFDVSTPLLSMSNQPSSPLSTTSSIQHVKLNYESEIGTEKALRPCIQSSRSLTQDDFDDRSKFSCFLTFLVSVGSSTTEGTLSHGDGCVIKTYNLFA